MWKDSFLKNNEILNEISLIDEFKGSWKALKQMQPEILTYLKKVATIESVGSSNRIEGNKLSDKEIEKLLSNIKITSFKSRDEEEIAGYAELLNIIFDDYEIIPFTENYIKQFHSILLKYSTKDEHHKGEYKKVSNSVSAFDKEGKEIGIIFETASPFDTPRLMTELIDWTNKNLKERVYHPLIVIAMFVVNFLAIHPFQDGNGRLSRALTNLLLMKAGYHYVAYSSLEAVIEDNKVMYYKALRETQGMLKEEEPDYATWVNFFIKSLEKQKNRLEYKIEHIAENEKEIGVANILDEKDMLNDLPITAIKILKLFESNERISIKEIKENIDENEGKIKRGLRILQEKNIIKKHGKTNGCWYTKM